MPKTTTVSKKAKHNKIKEILESKKVYLSPWQHWEGAETQIKLTHKENDGFVAVATKKEGYQQWCVETDELLKNLQGIIRLEDTYVSVNGFCSPRRTLQSIRHLNTFFVDLDYYKISKYKNKTAEEMIQTMRARGIFSTVAEPSFFVDSGNGMYIFWLLEKSANKQMLPLWQTVENRIIELFAPFGADPQASDAARVLRLSGTINSKTGRRARLIYNTDKKYNCEAKQEPIRFYTIPYIADKILPPLPYSREEWQKLKRKKLKAKKSKKKKKETNNVLRSKFNLFTLNYFRYHDLITLVELREGNCKHYRELICFLYRYWSVCYCKDEDQALIGALQLNSMFVEPLNVDEVINATVSANDAFKRWQKTFDEYIELENKPDIVQYFRKRNCYIYSNKKLIKLLDITQDEIQHLSTIINLEEKLRRKNIKRRKDRRNENGLTIREQQKEDKIQEIKRLSDEGKKQIEIATELGVAKSLVSMYLKEIKEREDDNLYELQADESADIDAEDMTDIEQIYAV